MLHTPFISRHRSVVCTMTLALGVSASALAQDTTHVGQRDSTRADSVARLRAVTIVVTPAERAQPLNATHVDAATIRSTPASSPYELLRQTSGVEVHLQGQGPGFASDASLRGFSSDHATDLALWVDGVPINEPLDLAPTAARWRIRLSGNWVGPYSPFDEARVVLGGYGLAHVSATWNFPDLETDVGVRNVFAGPTLSWLPARSCRRDSRAPFTSLFVHIASAGGPLLRRRE